MQNLSKMRAAVLASALHSTETLIALLGLEGKLTHDREQFLKGEVKQIEEELQKRGFISGEGKRIFPLAWDMGLYNHRCGTDPETTYDPRTGEMEKFDQWGRLLP